MGNVIQAVMYLFQIGVIQTKVGPDLFFFFMNFSPHGCFPVRRENRMIEPRFEIDDYAKDGRPQVVWHLCSFNQDPLRS